MPKEPKPEFYKTTFTITVLSDEPLGGVSLGNLEELVNDGPCVLHTQRQRERVVNGKTMANLLYDAGSEPGFFRLDNNGNPTDEE